MKSGFIAVDPGHADSLNCSIGSWIDGYRSIPRWERVTTGIPDTLIGIGKIEK
jgi:hypothetical protein